MNNLHYKIYTAKKLLLKQAELGGENNTFSALGKSFNLSRRNLIDLAKDGLIVFSDCLLSKKYIERYRQLRKEFETNQYKKSVAYTVAGSGGGGFDPKKAFGWDFYLANKYCDLEESTYKELLKNNEVKVNILEFEKTLVGWDVSPLDYIRFKLEIDPQKIAAFLKEAIDLFIKDELDLSDEKTQRHLSYQAQKEHFAIAITKQTNFGYSPNNLKIDYTQIWSKEIFLQTNFIETALGMEQEGLIEVKDIIEPEIPELSVITSDLGWRYPTIIQLKTFQSFSEYYQGVYDKHNPKKNLSGDAESKKIQNTVANEIESNTPAESNKLSKAEAKKLCLLEKLREEWDLAPKGNGEPIMIQAGIYGYLRPAGEVRITQQKFSAWERECGISDWYELENILTFFKQEGIITKFSIQDEYE